MSNTYSKPIMVDDQYDINEEEIDYLDNAVYDEYYYYLDYIEQMYD
jgi:hypothetical protein